MQTAKSPQEGVMCDLRHTDCLEYMAAAEHSSVHLTVTSPPYYNAREYSHWNSYGEYLDFMREAIDGIYKLTVPGRIFCLNVSPVIEPRLSRQHESKRYAIPFHLFNLCEEVGWSFLDEIVWLKPEGAAKNRNGGFYRHRKPVAYKPNVVTESILVFRKLDGKLIDSVVRSYNGDTLKESLVEDGYEMTNVWKMNPETKSLHTAPFPVKLPENLIKYYSFVGDVVFDPFLGSGTSGLAALTLKRQFIGVESDLTYFKIAKQRISNLSTNVQIP